MRKGRETLFTFSGEKRTRAERRILALGYWLAVETLWARCEAGQQKLIDNPDWREKHHAKGVAVAQLWSRLECRAIRHIARMATADPAIEREFVATNTAMSIATLGWAPDEVWERAIPAEDIWPEIVPMRQAEAALVQGALA